MSSSQRENDNSNISLLIDPSNDGYVSFGRVHDSDSDGESYAESDLTEIVSSGALDKTIHTLNDEIALKVQTILPSKSRPINETMLNITEDFNAEISSTSLPESIARLNETSSSISTENNILLLPSESQTSGVTFANLEEGDGFRASSTRDFGQIIANTLDEQTFDNLYKKTAAESSPSSFLSKSIIATPTKNGNIELFLSPRNAKPTNRTPEKTATIDKVTSGTLKRKLPMPSRNVSGRKPCYMRVLVDESNDDSDFDNADDLDKNQEIDKVIDISCDQDQPGSSTAKDGEDDNESESDKEMEIDDDVSDDDLPLASVRKKRARCSTLIPERRRGPGPKKKEIILVSKNLMPKGSHKAEYVIGEKPKANGKGVTKECRKLNWSTEPPDTESNVKPIDELPKLSATCTLKDPLQIFNAIFTDDVCNKIVEYTNRFAHKETKKHEGTNKYKAWKETDAIEIRAFIGSILFLGAHHKANLSADKLFTTTWYELNLPTILSFGKDRYKSLIHYMRFSSKTGPNDNSEAENRLIKIEELFDPIIKNSRALVSPGKVITVDEAVIGFKGKCVFTQYLPNKPAKYGVKVWCACDAKTGYLLNAQIYSGKVGRSPEVNQGRRVVMDLLEPYFDTDRIVVTDNFFTSIHLADDLKAKSLGLVGTLREGRPGVPKEFYAVDLGDEKKKKKLVKKGKNCLESSSEDEPTKDPIPKYKTTTGRPRKRKGKGQFDTRSAFLFTPDFTIVKALVKPKRSVCLFSSIHHASLISTDDQAKPEIILFYNQGKCGVDLLGQVIKNFSCKQTTHRWPYRVFTWLMDVAAYNAYVVYRSIKSIKDSDMENCRRDFLTKLSVQLMEPQIRRRCKTEKLQYNKAHILKVKNVAFACMKMKKDNDGKEGLDLLGVQETDCKQCSAKSTPKPSSNNSKAQKSQMPWDSTSAKPTRTWGGRRCYATACRINARKSKRFCNKCQQPVCAQHRNEYSTSEGKVVFCKVDLDAGVHCKEIFGVERKTVGVQCKL